MQQQKKPQNEKTAPKGKGGDKESAQPQRLQIMKPMLPGAYDRMLRNEGTDKNLSHIVVKFYGRGVSEVSFAVRMPDRSETRVMTIGEYQDYRHSLEGGDKSTKETAAAEQFFRKLEARCWVKTSNYSVENARRVKALTWPIAMLSAFKLTQKDVKSKKLTSSRLFAIWMERTEKEKEILNAFQKEVDPAYVWTETITSYGLFMERTAKEETEKKKTQIKRDVAVLASDVKWGDVHDIFTDEPKLPLTATGPGPAEKFDPFSENEKEDSDHKGGEDPLDRPLSPKGPKEGPKRTVVDRVLGRNKGEEEKKSSVKTEEDAL